MSVKNCSKCNQTKDISNFCKHKDSKDGLQSNCKQCASISSKQWKINNPEKNRESHQKTFKKYYIIKEKTPKDIRKQQLKEYQNEWMKNKRKDPLVKLHNSLMHAVWKSLKINSIYKNQSTLEILGLESWDKFREHIESQWIEGMSWENYGNTKESWSIDHIKPKSLAKTEEEVKKLNHYTNLRPMWHVENIKKSNKIKI
jgi:hypothetical protein